MKHNRISHKLARQPLAVKTLAIVGVAAIAGAASMGLSHAATLSNTGYPLYDSVCNKTMNTYTSGTLSNSVFTETSGIAPAHQLADTYWVHNDSGASAKFYSIDKTGKLLGSFTLYGVKAVDWEDIDVGPGPVAGTSYVYVADTGDNDLNRSSVQIYRVPEPKPNQSGKSITVTGAERLNFIYPGGVKRNVEAVFVDQSSGAIYLVDKSDKRKAEVYTAPAGLANGSTTTLTKIATIGYASGTTYEKFTGADMSLDGNTIALATYDHVYVYNRPVGASVVGALAGQACTLPNYSESKGEAVGFKLNGNGLVTVSEGKNRPLHNYDRR